MANSVRVKKMSMYDLVEQIDEKSESQGIDVKGDVKPYVEELAKRLSLTPMEALFYALFLQHCDNRRIDNLDLTRHFGCGPLRILPYEETIYSLVRKGVVIRRMDSEGECTYRVPREAVKAFKQERLPEVVSYANLSSVDFLFRVSVLLNKRGDGELTDRELEDELSCLMEENQQLVMVQSLKKSVASYSNQLLLLGMGADHYVNHYESICRRDLECWFDEREARIQENLLRREEHPLEKRGYVEFFCVNGQIESAQWSLSKLAKEEFFPDFRNKESASNDLYTTRISSSDIREKRLFYPDRVLKSVNKLSSLLDENRMKEVLRRLADNNMRQGFTCVFYGGPGTGKTESVLQLGRMSGRDIVRVDISNIRDKWVGESEKNLKTVFDHYRSLVRNSEKAPILFFNEADALFNKRNENSVRSVDKMENAMQNILLQELEDFEGILIATTNLVGNLDAAFERRFLYKIEFEKPTANERKQIWKSMLTDLTDEQAFALAERFDFSGGQIENIARKRLVDDILNGQDGLVMTEIVANCENELFNSRNNVRKVGF